MPHDGLDFSRRAQLSELMDEPCSREVIEACLRDLARVNRWFGAYRPVLRWLDEMRQRQRAEPLRILDVGMRLRRRIAPDRTLGAGARDCRWN